MGASLYTSKITGGLMRRVDGNIQKFGFAKTMQMIFEKTHSKIEFTKESAETDVALEKEPTIVICNHPSEAEVLILLSAMDKRDDVHLVANHSFLNILPSLDKHVIPVYIVHRLVADQLNLKFRLLQKIHSAEEFSKEESHQKNIESINKAAEMVSKGGLVIIFPAAGEEEGRFLAGIGHMVKGLGNKSKAKLVMAYVRGTSTFDYLRLIPLLNRFMPKIQIDFASPISIAKYKSEQAREIAKEIETDFYSWSKKFINAD